MAACFKYKDFYYGYKFCQDEKVDYIEMRLTFLACLFQNINPMPHYGSPWPALALEFPSDGFQIPQIQPNILKYQILQIQNFPCPDPGILFLFGHDPNMKDKKVCCLTLMGLLYNVHVY